MLRLVDTVASVASETEINRTHRRDEKGREREGELIMKLDSGPIQSSVWLLLLLVMLRKWAQHTTRHDGRWNVK